MSGKNEALDARAWQTLSVLLGYPDEELYGNLPLLHRAAATLPAPVAGPLARFLAFLGAGTPEQIAQQYVATFDHKRRGCLYLTYYTHGDTRKRGVALLRLKQQYAAAGLRLAQDELPDHLCVALEFAAARPEAGRRLLTEYRAGVELLRLALADAGSPWRDLLDALSATLPALTGDQRAAAARLAAQGPPDEQVGLEPFAPPQYMPESVGGRR
ncbi:nitrate reductase molybdenum cofactor assembly chaperone [Actinocrinis puniceicyclus]|uniref:Nitrate reductase molybdenum cofactor assembly chaperone n=1 Tax=Actinocrinis puniceicyclus TaxID=977794 RepID=A0A8J7WUE6_9ACTN|nr:nitrate reductase molybdenum cofactor assembly chaperone [Actinocrinis puniceicyclus]MBS2965955.1 nitrate reductase molybdenum cofactor assembly chaperone [Actinocrinis puniceicyclus]